MSQVSESVLSSRTENPKSQQAFNDRRELLAATCPDFLAPGTFLLPLRLIVGWTYFSAFWRRVVLENKLDPDAAGYLGEKFNHFLPNALFIKPAIEYFVSNPEILWWKLVAFTIIEAIVGGLLMVGFMTRAMGIATSLLALGILLGAGWLGTTCLDEWQIGILGIGSGIAFAWCGGGRFSLDHSIALRLHNFGLNNQGDVSGSAKPGRLSRLICRLISWNCSDNAIRSSSMHYQVIVLSALTFGLTLYTNQVFHGGVWGKLHNLSVSPEVELSNSRFEAGQLQLELYRVEGADVYGSFAIEIRLMDSEGETLALWDGEQLSKLSAESISNRYVAKIKSGPHSLILPLGARGTIKLSAPTLRVIPNAEWRVELTDISGQKWSTTVEVIDSKELNPQV